MLSAQTGWLGLHPADWAVLIGYFVVIAAIGVWSMIRVKDMADFFMGGRRFGKVFMMFFAFGSGTSSDQAITVVAGTWRAGLAGIWWQFLWLWATPFYWIVAPALRRMRALTTADFFEHRFHRSTALLYAIYGIIMAIVFIASGLYVSGKMVNALTNNELNALAQHLDLNVPYLKWDGAAWRLESGWRQVEGYELAILAMTVLFVAYGMAGGLGAAIITDFLQGILTIAFSFLLLPFVFYKIGGFGALNRANDAGLKEGMLNLFDTATLVQKFGFEPITIFYVFMLSVTALAGIIVQPHIMGVCGAGKTEFEGRFGFTVGNFMKRFCTIAWTFTGLAALVWYLGDDSPLKHPNVVDSVNQSQAADAAANVRPFDKLTPDEQKKVLDDRKLYADLKARISEDFEKLPPEERSRLEKLDKQFSDQLFGQAAYDILPTISAGLIGLLLASLLAAIMSSADAQMVIGSGLFTENIYRRYIAPNRSQGHYLWVGRIAGLLVVAFSLGLQTTFSDVIDALQTVIKTPAAIGISMWFAIVWRRWNTIAVWVSTFTAIAAWALVAYFPGELSAWLHNAGMSEELLKSIFKVTGTNVDRMWDKWQMATYISAGVLSGVIVSLLTPMQPKEKLDHFYRLLHTPVTPGEIVPGPCQLPENPAPENPKLFPHSATIEFQRPTWVGLGGFLLAWVGVGLIVGLTYLLARFA